MFKKYFGFGGHHFDINDCVCKDGPGHHQGWMGNSFGDCHGRHGMHHGSFECCTTDQGRQSGLQRRFISPEEKKEHIKSYIDVLQKEIRGAEQALKELD